MKGECSTLTKTEAMPLWGGVDNSFRLYQKYQFRFRHSHGGIALEFTHNPLLASLASVSNFSSVVSSVLTVYFECVTIGYMTKDDIVEGVYLKQL